MGFRFAGFGGLWVTGLTRIQDALEHSVSRAEAAGVCCLLRWTGESRHA